jgi:predicted porin
MIGGLRGAGSRLALAVIVSAVGAVAFAQKPAKAADLGGDCCSDLEERVAELEATTVRKGNKKVSITLYGKINRAVLFWDDGAERNVYSVDNSYESSRFGLKGSAKIGGDWSAGYRIEAETRAAASEAVNQIDDDNGTRSGGTLGDEGRLLLLRHSFLYLDNKKYGQVRLGLQYTPKDDITKDTDVTELEDTMTSDNHMNRGFFLRPKGFNTEVGSGPGTVPPGIPAQLKWQAISQCYGSTSAFDCSTRRNGVSYWTPTWAGFTASWGWFEDDIWGGALRYHGSFTPFGGGTGLSKDDTFEVGWGIAYEKFRDENIQNSGGGLNGFRRDIDEWAGMASIKHKPTGLFAFGAFSFSDTHDSNREHAGIFTGTSSPDMSAWDARIGIQRDIPWFGLDKLGETSIFGGYLEIHDGIGGACGATRSCRAGTFPDLAIPTEIVGSLVTRWYVGYDQSMVNGYLHLYGVYQHLTADVGLVNSTLQSVSEPLDDFDLFYTGMRLYY